MKIYKITFNQYGYDEYDSFILKAQNVEQAIKILKERHPGTLYDRVINWEDGYKIEEVNLYGDAEILLGSFNAG